MLLRRGVKILIVVALKVSHLTESLILMLGCPLTSFSECFTVQTMYVSCFFLS